MEPYSTETMVHDGKEYIVEFYYDSGAGFPWDREDGHGPVSNWERRAKAPGEMILSEDTHVKRFYDFQEAVKIAKRDGWNTEPYEFATPGQQAHAAALADFEYLRSFCNDEWHYCGIVVTLKLDNCECCGQPRELSASLWGIESFATDYHQTAIKELIAEIEEETNV